MRWQELLGLAVMASTLVQLGCGTSHADLKGPDMGLLASRVPEGDGASQTRAQKPDPKKPAENLLSLGPDRQTAGKPAARIRAVVNGEAILDEEVIAAAYQGLAAARTEAERAEVLNQKLNELIDREVVLQDAFQKLARGGEKFLTSLRQAAAKEFDRQWMQRMMKGNGFTDEKEFREFLRSKDMPLEMIRRQWERNFIAMEYMRHRIEPFVTKLGHLQIKEYYEKHRDQFQVEDSVDWQDLFVATARHPNGQAARQFAESLVARIRKGEDFVKLVKEYDNGTSFLRENAEGNGHKRGEITPSEVESTLFQLDAGQVGPVIEIPTGFHIVKVTRREKAGLRPLDEKLQKEIREKLRNEVFGREMKRIVAELKRKAVIEVANEL